MSKVVRLKNKLDESNKKFDFPSVQEAKKLHDKIYTQSAEYEETIRQIQVAIEKYINRRAMFPIHLYDKKGEKVSTLHFYAKQQAEEKGYLFEKDYKGYWYIDIE